MRFKSEDLLKLYPKYDSVLGPYKRKDGRKHIVLNDSSAAKGEKGKTKTISYPKAIMECRLGRRLLKDETVDHDDDDFTNNSKKNLQIMSRSNNAAKGHRTGALTAKYIVDYSRSKEGREASSRRMKELNSR